MRGRGRTRVPRRFPIMSHNVANDVAVRQNPRVPPAVRIADRYDVIEPLGHGGMATTYLVRDIVDGTRLALKLLHSDQPAMVEALRFEFRTLQALHHPHLCPVHDFGFLHPGDEFDAFGRATCFYTAEAIEGVTLDSYANGREWAAALAPLVHALEALRLLHRVGVRHGDLKPGNVLVRGDGTGVLVDLGCARPLDMPPTTQVSGTRAFLAPELLRGEASDARADLFAVGVTLHRLASITQTRPSPNHARLISALRSPNPDARPQSVDEVLEALGAQPVALLPASTWRGRFVGRDAQLAAAQRATDALVARKASSRVLCVTGNPGAGRSRLLQEIEWQTQPRCRVVRASQTAPLPIEDMLARAIRRPVPPGLLGIVEALRELTTHDEPVVLILDDAQRLAATHRERLAAVVRLIEPNGPVMLLMSSARNCLFREPGVKELPIAPLTATELGLWLAPTFETRTIHAFARLTGGYPDAVIAVIALLRSGRHTEDDLASIEGGPALYERWALRLRSLPPPQRRAAGLMALLACHLSEGAARSLDVAPASIEALREAGLVTRHGPGWKLLCPVEAMPVAEVLPQRLRKRLHAEFAAWLRDRAPQPGDAAAASEQLAMVAWHLAQAGKRRDAESLVRKRADEHRQAPGPWLDAIENLLTRHAPHEAPVNLVVYASQLLRVLGRARDARARLSSVADRCKSGAECGRLHMELGVCHAELGELQSAEQELLAALDDLPEEQGQVIVALTHVQVRKGAYEEALKTVRQAQRLRLPNRHRAQLHAIEGEANSHVGNTTRARRCFRAAIQGLEQAGCAESQAQAMTSLARLELRQGALETATRTLEAGLHLARRQDLAKPIGELSLSLGVARHQQGAWIESIEAYEKGLRVARALGSRATEATLLYSLGKVHADLGAFDRAQQLADRGRELASLALLPLKVAAADTVLAEVEHARGRVQEAEARLLAARAAFATSDGAAEVTEIELQLAEIAIQQDQKDRMHKWVDDCVARISGVEGPYLLGRLALVRAKAARHDGQDAEAIQWVEEAVDRFAASRHRDAEAQAHLLLAQLATEKQAPHLARQHLSLARALWERSAAPLPSAQRKSFWLHPSRIGARDAEPRMPSLVPKEESALQRLFEINKRLNSSLEAEDVLRTAMDAATELTGAKRGFVLLQDPASESHLAIVHNIDGSHLEFSRAIAQEVTRTGRPVLNADPANDDRFRSHATLIKSVACVPIQSPEGILGALYLDDLRAAGVQLQQGSFADADVRLLLAFAEQVALALRNARLFDALKHRNAQLEQQLEKTSKGKPPGRAAFERTEKERILAVLDANRWNIRKAAPILGLPRSTLYRKLKRYGIVVRSQGKRER